MKARRITKLKRTLRRSIDTAAGTIMVTITPDWDLRVRRKYERQWKEHSYSIAKHLWSDQRVFDL